MTRNISETLKNFVEAVVRLIVDNPKSVEVTSSTSTKAVLIQIKVDKEDIGKVIGKKGRTISSIKLLSTVVKNTQFIGDSKDVFVEIIEDENSTFLEKINIKIHN